MLAALVDESTGSSNTPVNILASVKKKKKNAMLQQIQKRGGASLHFDW